MNFIIPYFFKRNGKKKFNSPGKTMPCSAMKQKRNVKIRHDFGNRKSMNPNAYPIGAVFQKKCCQMQISPQLTAEKLLKPDQNFG
jgi:hypothetical protein